MSVYCHFRTSSTSVPHKWGQNPGQPHPRIPPPENPQKSAHLPRCTIKQWEVNLIPLEVSPRPPYQPKHQLQTRLDLSPWAISPVLLRSNMSWPECFCFKKMLMSLWVKNQTRATGIWRNCWPKSCWSWTLWRLRDKRLSDKPERKLYRGSRPFWTSWRRKLSELELIISLWFTKSSSSKSSMDSMRVWTCSWSCVSLSFFPPPRYKRPEAKIKGAPSKQSKYWHQESTLKGENMLVYVMWWFYICKVMVVHIITD